jgi:hypothetical protein
MSRVRVRGWWALPLLVVALFAAPWPTWMIEHGYTRLLYPRLQHVITSVSNLTPLAIMDLGLPLIGVWLLFVLWRMISSGRDRGWGSGLWEAVRRVVRVAAILALAFLVCWGFNYRRVPLEEQLRRGAPAAPAVADLVALARHAAAAAGPLRDAALTQSADYEAIAARLAPSFQAGLQRLGLPMLSLPGRPKISHVLTPFFTAAGVTGMVNPIALESIVHPELLPFERPMVLAHEWAHLAGFADEADASAIAWLACVTGDASLAYSAHFFVVLETASALPPAEWRAIRATLSPGVVEDIAALRKRLTRQEPVVREAAFTVYDSYLKTNRVDDGVRSYSRVLRVLLTPPMLAAIRNSQ